MCRMPSLVQLWGVALRALKGVLEPAFELQLSTAPQMLMVKEFVVLMCVALERAGHQVSVRHELVGSGNCREVNQSLWI
jgi:hypothetical protein